MFYFFLSLFLHLSLSIYLCFYRHLPLHLISDSVLLSPSPILSLSLSPATSLQHRLQWDQPQGWGRGCDVCVFVVWACVVVLQVG